MPLRDTIVGAATGVTLLAGVVGFAVGLPEATGDEPGTTEEAAEVGDVADLMPDTILDGAIIRFADLDPQFAPVADEVEGFSAEQLAEVFGEDAAVGIYTTPRGEVQVSVTIYAGESGLFIQTGPPVPPEMSANSETYGQYVTQGDNICFAQTQVQAPEGTPPFQVQCQQVVGGHTVNVYVAGGLSVQQTADIVDDVVAQAGLS